MRNREDLEHIRAQHGDAGRLAALTLTALDRQAAFMALAETRGLQGDMAQMTAAITHASLEAQAWDLALDAASVQASPATAGEQLQVPSEPA